MKYLPAKPIKLTDAESLLLSIIPATPGHDGWHQVADAMETLFESLQNRHAIPEVRLRFFFDPEFAESGNKSRHEVFESTGTFGNEVYRHPNFISYLKYFIQGPDLPTPVIDGLCGILNDDAGTSGMVMDKYCKYARQCIRQYGIDRRKAASEFFRLGVEIGMELHAARTLREAAQSAR